MYGDLRRKIPTPNRSTALNLFSYHATPPSLPPHHLHRDQHDNLSQRGKAPPSCGNFTPVMVTSLSGSANNPRPRHATNTRFRPTDPSGVDSVGVGGSSGGGRGIGEISGHGSRVRHALGGKLWTDMGSHVAPHPRGGMPTPNFQVCVCVGRLSILACTYSSKLQSGVHV